MSSNRKPIILFPMLLHCYFSANINAERWNIHDDIEPASKCMHWQYSGRPKIVQGAPEAIMGKRGWTMWPPACQPSAFSQHPSQIQNHWIEEHKFNSIGNWVELGLKHKKSKWMMNLRRVFKCTIWPPAAEKWLCPHLESRCCILPGLSISIWDYRHSFYGRWDR